MSVKVYIITHKKVQIPMIENLKEYEIIQTGNNKAPRLGYRSAAEGENIAFDNAYYADMTAHYWIWKNENYDYVGINQYSKFLYYNNHIITGSEIEELLEKYDILLPHKLRLRTSVEAHWNRLHCPEDLVFAAEVIKSLYPEYEETYQKFIKSEGFYICTIYIAKKEIFNAYCEWVFPILERVRQNIDISKYPNASKKRVGGFLAERLINVWINYNQLSKYELELKLFPKKQFDLLS